MKTRLKAVTIVVIFAAVIVWACAPKAPSTFSSTGVITEIDPGTRTVTVNHENIPGFMHAMDMSFTVGNASMLNGFVVGDTVSFRFERSNDDVTLLEMTRTGAAPSINGGDLFAINCAKCHGAEGEGTKKGIPLISGHALMHSDAEFIEQVNDGTEDKMPAFRDKLSAEEIAAVVKYVRTVIQAGFKHEEMKEHKH